MKLKIWIIAMTLAFAAASHGATNDLTGLLQKGMFEEEANRNLDAAISNYQSLANAFDKDRQLAATAIFRLGECYRKLGKTNEAVIQYERIIREFSDQQTLATLSQQNLAGLNASAPPAKTAESADAGAAGQLQALLLKAQAQYTERQSLLKLLKGMNREELKKALPTVVVDNQLNTLMSELDVAEQELVRLKTEYSEDHPNYKNARVGADDLRRKIDERIDGILTGLQTQVDASAAYMDSLKMQMEEAQSIKSKPAPATTPQQSTVTDEEEKEILRIQAMIQNSPDLINAPSGDPHLTPLGRAAELGQLRVAKFLLDAKADVNLISGKETPLQGAASNGQRAMVELLLANGADVNAKDPDGRTALHSASRHGFVSVAETLLAAKADVNAQDPRGNTPLTFAVQNGFRPAAELLLSHGADPNLITTKVPQGWGVTEDIVGTPLHFAVLRGDEPVVSLLLSNRANTELRNLLGKTVLDLAAEKGSVEIARRLLGAGANPNQERANRGDPSPLYRAVIQGNTNMVKLLLAKGANPNQGSYNAGGPSESSYSPPLGMTPLMKAVLNDNQPMVMILLQNKANPNLTNDDGYTAFWYGIRPKGAKSLVPLLEYGADPNQLDEEGRLPLMGVAEFDSFLSSTDRLAVARLLIAKGADVNARSPHGNTALHWAALYKRPELVDLLLANKADANVQNHEGKTPLELAKGAQSPSAPGTLRIESPRSLYSPGTAGVVLNSDNSSGASASQDIVALLHQHGALDDLPDFSAIRVTRQGIASPIHIFQRHSNDWNHFALLETLLYTYSGSSRQASLKFPDLTRIIIHRPTGSPAGHEKTTTVNLLNSTNGVDCSKDVPLEFGDVVEIPVRDYALNENVVGLNSIQTEDILSCLKGTVHLIVRDQSREMSRYAPYAYLTVTLRASQAQSLLLSSSDLTRVKVTRKNAHTGKTQEFIVDTTTSTPPQDLWLENGDVIEVPEK